MQTGNIIIQNTNTAREKNTFHAMHTCNPIWTRFLIIPFACFIIIVFSVNGEINFETDFHSKIYSGISLRLKNGEYYIADTPGAVPANDVSMHPAVDDVVTGVEDIPLSVQKISEILSQDNVDVVLPLIDSGLYNGLEKPFKVQRFVRIQTFSPTTLNLRPTNQKRIEALKKHIAGDTKRRKLVEEEHKKNDNENNFNRRMGRPPPNNNIKVSYQQKPPTAAAVAAAANNDDDGAKESEEFRKHEEKENEEWEKYKIREKKEEQNEKKEEAKKKRSVEMQNEQIKKNEDRDKKQKEQTEKARVKAEKRQVEKKKEQKFKRIKRVERPGYDYFEVRFETKGPLGVWFTPSKYPPTIDRSQGKRTRLRLAAGDTLIAVNNELIIDVVKTEKLSDVMDIISKAKWPKRLRFERKKRSKEESQVKVGAGFLSILWPRIMKFDYPILKAQFGPGYPCGLHNFSIAEPFEACKDLSNKQFIEEKSIVLVGRGVCTFSKKAYAAQHAGGGSVVMVNTEQKLLDMPAGNGNLDDLNTPMFVIGVFDGAVIKVANSLLNPKQRSVVAKYVIGEEEEALVVDDNGEVVTDENDGKNVNTKCDIKDDGKKESELQQKPFYQLDFNPIIDKIWNTKYKSSKDSVYGNLILWDGEETKAFQVQMASFGGSAFPAAPFVFTMSTPFDACRGLQAPIKHAVVAIERGKCQMLDKAKLAQGAGSLGLIVVNTEPKIMSPYADPKEAIKVTIPVALVSSEARDFIVEKTRSGKRRIIGKVIISAEQM